MDDSIKAPFQHGGLVLFIAVLEAVILHTIHKDAYEGSDKDMGNRDWGYVGGDEPCLQYSYKGVRKNYGKHHHHEDYGFIDIINELFDGVRRGLFGLHTKLVSSTNRTYCMYLAINTYNMYQ
jgi:hypothetical protein